MSSVEKDFKKLDKDALKLLRESEKNSKYISLKKSTQLLRIVLFIISILIISFCMYFTLEKSLLTTFKDLFLISKLPSILITGFISIGITTLFFMRNKVVGRIVISLSILILGLAIIYFIDSQKIHEGFFTFLLYIILIILSLITLIRAYYIRKEK